MIMHMAFLSHVMVQDVQREEATDDMIMGGGRWASDRRKASSSGFFG